LTKKKSRTAVDFPLAKISNGALKLITKGWSRSAHQKEPVREGSSTVACTVQATTWKDTRLVGFLHNYKVNKMVEGEHSVLRWSPAARKRIEIESPAVTPEYAKNMGRVDMKDRDTSDWTVSVRMGRYYFRIFFWLLDGTIHAMYIVVCEIFKQSPDHPWAKYRKRDGRFEFQMDLAHAIIECGISLDCPDLEDLRDRKKRPGYMRKQDWIPCNCNRCFFANLDSPTALLVTSLLLAGEPTPPQKIQSSAQLLREQRE
jgi:hypothetical protein